MKYIFLTISALLFASCEKVIDVKLDTTAPKLVIDAALKWQKGTSGSQQTIKLITTTGYNQNQFPKASGATITVTNSSNTAFNFIENPNLGNYVCTNFIPVIGETYMLKIAYNGQIYTATEILTSSPNILNVEQRNDLGLNSDEIGIKVNFQDVIGQQNFYLFSFSSTVRVFPDLEAFEDNFFDGRIGFGLFTNKDLKKGNQINITLNGISKPYYNYLKVLIGLSDGAGGPFGTTPATTLRGNIINTTNKDNYALGYFSVSQTDSLIYTTK